MPETTDKKQDTRFKSGQSGNPAGRPKGSRNKVSEKLLEALATDFDAHGKEVIEKVRTDRPADYLKIVASLVPKQMEIEDLRSHRKAEDLSDDELAAIALQGPTNGIMPMLEVSPQRAAQELLKRRRIRLNLVDWARCKGFEPAKHHQLIVNEIEAFLMSEDEVLLLFAPPGSAKSTYVSILLPSWYLANNPNAQHPRCYALGRVRRALGKAGSERHCSR